MGRIPIASHAEVVTAGVIIKIVVEAAQLPVLKTHAGEARTARNRRRHHFRDHAKTPLLVAQMIDFIADAQIQSLSFSGSEGPFVATMKMLKRQVDVGNG